MQDLNVFMYNVMQDLDVFMYNVMQDLDVFLDSDQSDHITMLSKMSFKFIFKNGQLGGGGTPWIRHWKRTISLYSSVTRER